MSILALLSGILLASAPAAAPDSDYVFLKAKIVAINGYYFDEDPPNGGFISHSAYTFVALKVERVIWGKYTPKKARAILRMIKYPIKPHIGRQVYLFAFNWDEEDKPLDVEEWGFRDEKICLDDDDAKIYDIPKEDFARLISAGLVKC